MPAAPIGLAASAGGSTASFSWQAVSGATSYQIQIGTSPGDSSVATAIITPAAYSRGLSPGTYWWRVRAQNAAGWGAVSTDAALTVAAPAPAPAAPTNFSAAVNGTTVTFSWTPPAGGASSYDLEVGSAPGAGNLGHFALSASPSTFAGVPLGTYYTRLRSLGTGGSSAPTADVTVVVAPAVCVPPGAVSVSSSVAAGVVTLNWSTPSGSGPFNYYLGVGSVPGAYDIGIFAMGAANGYVVAPPSRTYYVKAAAVNACGMGPISSDIAVVVP